MVFPILGGNSAVAGGYAIDNSLRFNDNDSPYLSRTPSTTTNRKTWTWSGWYKRSNVSTGTDQDIWTAGLSSGTVYYTKLMLTTNDTLAFANYNDTNAGFMQTNAKFRDCSAWYHIVLKVDTTQSTSTDRVKIYVNGVEQSVTDYVFSLTYPSQNTDTQINSNSYLHSISRNVPPDVTRFIDGYLAEVNFIDGQALSPTDFGEFDEDSGIWKPIEYTGTYGTNGFYLDFENSGSLGADQSGNGNNFTPTNLASTDQTTDTPTNNFCTLNPLANQLGTALSEGNLQQSDTGNDKNCFSTFGLNTGKWYFEVKAVSVGTRGNILITDADHNEGLGTNYARVQLYDGAVLTSATDNGNLSVFSNGDILCVALDLDNGQVWFSKNANINTGTTALVTNLPLTGTNRDYRVSHFGTATGTTVQFNFGNPPFSISSGNTDDNGYGNFEYAPPSGYLALCTQNLATVLSPTIDDGSAYFQTLTYAGNSSARTLTNDGHSDLQPDLIWIKSRTGAQWHHLFDSSRGGDYRLHSNSTNAESTLTNSRITSFNTDGFSTTDGENVNSTGNNYVAWQWKANAGSTSSNTDGSITSTVQANTTAGFSIVTYTGNFTEGATFGHGLGKAPKVVIIKGRTNSDNWTVYNGNLSVSKSLYLQTSDAERPVSPYNYWNLYWDETDPNSSVVTLGLDNSVNGNGHNFVAYCFAEIEGYSKFGKYTGNGSTDGTFVYTGFRPAFVIVKRTDSTGNWGVYDSKRLGYNVDNNPLYADVSDAEGTSDVRDLLSNGFKQRNTGGGDNASGGTFIYMAFAENPFVSSTGIPVTAR